MTYELSIQDWNMADDLSCGGYTAEDIAQELGLLDVPGAVEAITREFFTTHE